MSTFEGKYKNLQGNAVENDLAKIIHRYQTEGKSDPAQSENKNKKKVRINEEAREYEQVEENRI